MSDERKEFSRRLAAAMSAAGHEPRPSVLFKQFNSSFTGRSVSFQSASRWLNGQSIPEQDKLQVLARLYGVSPQALRFGDKPARAVAESRASWPEALNAADRSMLDAYLALAAERRKLVRELVQALGGRGS
ncbi:MAG: helix-turn-helix domain-containing protein [Lysobacter sp.]|nr:helix-turn-helix domain-containing protein [Lysobacter sp.]MDQ3268678.1 helix-turn-helix domain-containing protein [Pseudomonadota bacterium]